METFEMKHRKMKTSEADVKITLLVKNTVASFISRKDSYSTTTAGPVSYKDHMASGTKSPNS